MSQDADRHPLLSSFPVQIRLSVQWGEQDLFGHVNNIVYFRWFESARIRYGEVAGLEDSFRTRKIGPILAAVNCNYRLQVKYPDTVVIGARITRLGRTSLAMDHAVASLSQNALVADGTSTVVVFDYNAGKPFPIPDDLRSAVERIEGQSFPRSK